jgi:two-component system sensor histidine kinase CreC
MHGGEIEVGNAVGGGAEAVLSLPAAPVGFAFQDR